MGYKHLLTNKWAKEIATALEQKGFGVYDVDLVVSFINDRNATVQLCNAFVGISTSFEAETSWFDYDTIAPETVAILASLEEEVER